MTRIISVKITDPKECAKCQRVIGIGEWAMGLAIGLFACSTCMEGA